MTTQTTLSDVRTLREQARSHIDQGAVTAGYSADRTQVLKLLNDALATELVCMLRYRRHHFMARGLHAKSTAVARPRSGASHVRLWSRGGPRRTRCTTLV